MTMAPPPLSLSSGSPRPGKPYLDETEATHVAVYPNHGTVLLALRRERPDGTAFWQTFTELERDQAMALVGKLMEAVASNDLEVQKESK
jgi:hypothetical protein